MGGGLQYEGKIQGLLRGSIYIVKTVAGLVNITKLKLRKLRSQSMMRKTNKVNWK